MLTIAVSLVTTVRVPFLVRFGSHGDERSLTVESTPLAKVRSKTAIVTLTGSSREDIQDLCSALDSLHYLPDGNLAPVVVFHEADLPHRYQSELTKCTQRTLIFGVVDFGIFPSGFDPMQEKGIWNKRSKFGYMQMIRFFVTGLWNRPEIQDFETIMRLDSDACWYRLLKDDEENSIAHQERLLPGLSDDKVYHANFVTQDASIFCTGIFELAKEFVEQHNITIGVPSLWKAFKEKYEEPVCMSYGFGVRPWNCKPAQECLAFYNNFEASRISFFQHPLVQEWHTALTEKEPFGVFRHRWGDAIIRYLTMAMFANESNLELEHPTSYSHPCGHETEKSRHQYLIDLSPLAPAKSFLKRLLFLE